MSKRVAIVAVHGIGKHLPGETQDAITDLLLSLPGRGPYGTARRYPPFVSLNIQIPLQPVETIFAVDRFRKHSFCNLMCRLAIWPGYQHCEDDLIGDTLTEEGERDLQTLRNAGLFAHGP
jgi:hypothetical protein